MSTCIGPAAVENGHFTPPTRRDTRTEKSPWWRRIVLRTVAGALAPRWQVSGQRNLPEHGPYILVANHLSHCDAWYLSAAMDRPVRFMAMSEIFRHRLPAFLLRLCGAFPVARGAADRKSLAQAGAILESGQILGIFPEGYLSRDGALQPLKGGAVRLALQYNVPLVPVGLHGTERVMPYGPTLPRPTLERLRIHIGEPISLETLAGLSSRQARQQGLDLLTTALQECVFRAANAANHRAKRDTVPPVMAGAAPVHLAQPGSGHIHS